MKKTIAISFLLVLVLSGCLASQDIEAIALQAVDKKLQQEWADSFFKNCFFEQTTLVSEPVENSSAEVFVCFKEDDVALCKQTEFLASYLILVNSSGKAVIVSEQGPLQNFSQAIECGEDTIFWQ